MALRAPLSERSHPLSDPVPDDIDDEFDMSPEDEASLLEAGSGRPLKRKSEVELSDTGRDAKVPKREDETNATSPMSRIAQRILGQRFGMSKFRLRQEEVVDRILNGKSAVVVFPTSGGKSLCYQLPALCFKELDNVQQTRQGSGESGITIVVSPLIALMKDQVDALKRRGIKAAAMDSTKSKEEHLETVDSMRNGTLDILYCAPERLNNEGFVGSMANVKGGVRLLAIDEAHCISEWGHAFRPDYLKVARFAKEINAERVVCLTATATPTVAKDICKAFEVPEDGLFRTTTYRPNLRLSASSFQTKQESYPELRKFLKSHPGPTIIYVTLQKHTEDLANQLRKLGFKARHFHAGMDKDEKAQCQDEFMVSDDLIIVATIAFGMGIDKPNIRNVVHYDIPSSLEGYSQEIGRAGRDGLVSYCLLMLCAEDLHLRESFARGDLPSRSSVENLLKEVFSSVQLSSAEGLLIESNVLVTSKSYDIRPTVVNNIMAQLELRFGLIRAVTPKYTAYSYIGMRDTSSDTSPAAIAIRKHSVKKAKLTHIDVDAAARISNVSRMNIVVKLNAWNDARLIELRAGGVVNVFRVLKPLPTTAKARGEVVDELYADLETRESQALDRMQSVIDLITAPRCFAGALAQHFGDTLPDGVVECGNCSWCESKTPVKMVESPKRPWESASFFEVLKVCSARDDPRFLARVAFGISSPRVTKEKLGQHKVFGSMCDQDFVTLLNAFTKVCDRKG